VPTPPAAAPVSELRDRLVAVARRAYLLGLVPGVSGNLSVRVPGQAAILIKATGKSFGDMTAADTLLVDSEGHPLESAGGARPSKERLFHCAIYRRRPDVGAVLHLHPPHCVAFAAVHALPPMLTGAARAFLQGRLALVAPAPSGSPELASLVGDAFADPAIQAAILAEHGTITVGADLHAALYLSEYLEDAARTACLVGQIRGRVLAPPGGDPPP
jgi:ribulose-5-phosphate 4-epimerase/fuculose-1-phosphate aldolase